MYTEKVMDHFAHPRNMGEIKDANGVGMVGNAKCGDIMQMFLKVNDDGIIEDVGFKTFGCGAAVATSSMATELIKGKSIDEALKLTNSAVVEALEGLPPAKLLPQERSNEALRKKLLKRLSITTMPAKKAEPTANATAFPAATTMSMITIMNMKKMPKTDF